MTDVDLRTQQAYACNLQVVARAVIDYPISGDKLALLRKT